MKVFCPNCGSENEGLPGGRLTCQACTASFEVPRATSTPTSQPPQPQPIIAPTPVRPPTPAPPPKPPPQFGTPMMPQGYAGPPASGFGAGSALNSSPNNQLAIASLVLGIVCCIPFASIGAIVTGVMALGQIRDSQGAQKGETLAYAGIALGGASILLTIIGLLARH